MNSREKLINDAYEGKIDFQLPEVKQAVGSIITDLDQGIVRVATCVGGQWTTHGFIKQAILLYFRQSTLAPVHAGDLTFFDKIPLKQWSGKEGVRVVPHALVRFGAHVKSGAILMPSYVNIGAHIGEGTMIDTWATVGSCAQIGAHVHLSGGVGIGGVLEPIQGAPVIIEDHVFVGSRSIIVEGVIVESGAVLGAGVVLTASTRILDVTGSEVKIYKGRVPKNAVVIPGTIPKKFPAGEFGVPCALIIGSRSEKTDMKTSLTEALRDFS